MPPFSFPFCRCRVRVPPVVVPTTADCFLFALELAIHMKKRGGMTHPKLDLGASRVVFFKGG